MKVHANPPFRWRLLSFAERVLNRLQFFPLTFLFWLGTVAFRAFQLRKGNRLVRVAEVTGEMGSLPRNLMLWLGSSIGLRLGYQYDLCLRLPRESHDARLHDAFSVLLAFPGFRSVGLYWDSASLAEDLPLLQTKRDRDNPAVSALPFEDLGPPDIRRFEAFLRSNPAEIALPVAAVRESLNLLKRLAGETNTVCVNVPLALHPLAVTVALSRPDAIFFDLSPARPRPRGPENFQSLFHYGLTLHERMALAKAADAYLGSFDELGCAAVMSTRPAVLFGGGTGGEPERIEQGAAMWFPSPAEPAVLTEAVLQFLSRRMAPYDKEWGNAR